MVKPTSICTHANKYDVHKLNMLLKSIIQYNNDIPIYLACDEYIETFINQSEGFRPYVQMKVFEGLRPLKPQDCMEFALTTSTDTLYVNNNIIFFDEIPLIQNDKDIGLSPNYANEEYQKQNGNYDTGMIYVNNKSFIDWMDETTSLDNAVKVFTYFHFDKVTNFGWWRLFGSDDAQLNITKLNLNKDFKLRYETNIINSIQFHFGYSQYDYTFNNLIIKKMTAFKNLNNSFFVNNLKHDGITLICEYYNDENEERQKEIDECIEKNLANPQVKRIINFYEPHTQIPEFIAKHEKFHSIQVNERLTFKQAIDYANNNLFGKCVGILNIDIFLDENTNWLNMHRTLKHNSDVVYMLSRTEFDGKYAYKHPEFNKIGYANRIDAAFFISPIHVNDIDFSINHNYLKFAHRLKNNKYTPINSPNQYKIYHYDICRGQKNNTIMKDPDQYLLPDLDMVDELFNKIQFSKMDRYKILCTLLTEKILHKI